MVERPRALTRTVVIDGEVYGPGDVPPAHVAERIRNPQCWEPAAPEPGLRWVPEADNPQDWVIKEKPVAPAPEQGAVPQADPAPAGLRNLEPQDPATASSAVTQAGPGTIAGRPAPEEPVEQAGQRTEPPRSGRGASEAAWRAYAEQLGADIPAGADRSTIIARLKESGHIQ